MITDAETIIAPLHSPGLDLRDPETVRITLLAMAWNAGLLDRYGDADKLRQMASTIERIYATDNDDDDAGEHWYMNHYRCPCGAEWDDEWDCMCNDHCPACNKEIEPYASDDLTGVVAPMRGKVD